MLGNSPNVDIAMLKYISLFSSQFSVLRLFFITVLFTKKIMLIAEYEYFQNISCTYTPWPEGTD